MIKTYYGWQQVPTYLMTATQLGELEFPRTPPRRIDLAARVETRDWKGSNTTLALYDARSCQPTKASTAVLAAAAARATRPRVCADCGARCQRPPTTDRDDRPLCPACWQIARVREAQAEAREDQAAAAAMVAGWLADWPQLAVVQVDRTVPPPAPSGRARRATAARIWAVDAAGARLVDVTVRLVGPRAEFVPAAALDPADAVPQVHAALLGRPLVLWSDEEPAELRRAAPHPQWSEGETVTVWRASAQWRGELDWRTRDLRIPLAPGTPDRLALHLRRIAATAGDAPTTASTPG